MITTVVVSREARKQHAKLPSQVRAAFDRWATLIGEYGLHEVRKIRGYHDEPITRGPHAGERSVRLGRAWRLFYVLASTGVAEVVEVVEINKHLYDR